MGLVEGLNVPDSVQAYAGTARLHLDAADLGTAYD